MRIFQGIRAGLAICLLGLMFLFAFAQLSQAILQEGKRGFAMIVMGVNARPGDELFFGTTATSVLQGWEAPILMVAP